MIRPLWLALALLLVAVVPGAAHEQRPSYLELREVEGGRYEVLWKRPARGERTLALFPRWPEPCIDARQRRPRALQSSGG